MADKVVIEAEVKSNIGDLAKGIDKAKESTKGLARATKTASSGFKRLSSSIRGVGKAIKRAGIGVLMAAVGLFLNTLRKNQSVLDGFNTGMGMASIVMNDVIEQLRRFIIMVKGGDEETASLADNLGNYFKRKVESAKKSINHLGTAIKEGIKGNSEEAGKAINDMTNEMGKSKITQEAYENETSSLSDQLKEYLKTARETAAAQTELNREAEIAALKAQQIQAENLKDAEMERQIRDNVNKTIQDRIEANNRLGVILEENLQAQKDAINVSIQAIELDRENIINDENTMALMQKKIELAQVEEAMVGQQSEQLVNQIALENELRDMRIQLSTVGLDAYDLELKEAQNLYFERLRLAKLTGEDTTKIAEQFRKQKKQIAQGELNDQLGAASDLAGALSGLAGDNKELAAASAIIDTYTGANKAFAQGGILGYVSAAAIIAAGLANVKKIYATDVGGGGGGSVGSSAQPPAPEMLSGQFTLGSGEAPDPTRAYVVSDDITSNQNKLAIIRRRATI